MMVPPKAEIRIWGILQNLPCAEPISRSQPLCSHLLILKFLNVQNCLTQRLDCCVIYGPLHALARSPICITTIDAVLLKLAFVIFAGIPGMPFATPAPVPRMGMDPSSSVNGSPGQKDPNIKADLENSDLWSQFNDVGTEMIITKTGR